MKKANYFPDSNVNPNLCVPCYYKCLTCFDNTGSYDKCLTCNSSFPFLTKLTSLNYGFCDTVCTG